MKPSTSLFHIGLLKSDPCFRRDVQFLVDENISRSKKFISLHPEFTNASDDMKPGVIDDRVLDRAKEKGKVLITRDKRLVIRALIAGVRVWYFDSDNVGHPLQASTFNIDVEL